MILRFYVSWPYPRNKNHEKGVPVTVRLPAHERNLLLVVAGVVCLAAFTHFAFWPLLTRFKNIHQENKSRVKVLEGLIRLTGNADPIKNAYPRYAQYVRAGLTPEEQEGIFLRDVETIAKSSAVQIVNQQPYVVKDGADFLDIDLQIELEAPLRDIILFLYSIDNSNNLMSITQMRLIPKEVEGAQIFRCLVAISKRYIK